MNVIVRDERERAIDQAADRLSYLVLAFGVLAVVAYRAFVADEASWDLLALVVGAGVVGAGYRVWRQAVSRGWLAGVGLTIAIAVVVAVALVLTGRS